MAQKAARAWCDVNGAAFAVGDEVASTRAEVAADGTLLWHEVVLKGGGCLITAPDTRIEPIIAVLDAYEGGIPEGHPLRALLSSDMRRRLAALDGDARSTRKWERLTGKDFGQRLMTASEGLGSGHPACVVSYIRDWAQKRVTHWNQSARNAKPCYNYHTPNHYACGCVATVGAALLQFYCVTSAPQNVTNTCTVNKSSVSLTTKGIDYDWSVVSSWNGSTAPTEAQRELLGRVAYDVGVCIGMRYSSTGSSAMLRSLATALCENFGLRNARYVEGPVAGRYEQLIYSQLRCGAPVLLSISYRDAQNTRHGHAVVAVGYGEDADGVSYTRVFMGWGGYGDAWYALPDVSDYTTIDAVVTMIGTTDDVVPVYGRVTTADGIGAAQETVTVADRSLTTGAFGHYGVRIAPDASPKSVTFNGSSVGFAVGDDQPGAIDFCNAPEDTLLRMYPTLEEAQLAALADGKLLFVLSGADWCGSSSVVKDSLKALGRTFSDRYALHYCNVDCDNSGMANGTPYYGAFDPRAFSAAKRWAASNGCLASDGEGAADNVQAVLDAAWSTWTAKDRSVSSVQVSGPSEISVPTDYALVATHADGQSYKLSDGVIWLLQSGTAATLSGSVLTPSVGASGDVSLRAATARYWGSARSATLTVSAYELLSVGTSPLAAANAGEAYAQDLAVTGGKQPLAWSLPSCERPTYVESGADASSFSPVGTAQGWKYDDRCWTLDLPFAFSFFGKTYSQVSVGSNGVLSFDGFNFYRATEDGLAEHPMIAVLWNDLTTIDGDIYVTSSPEAVTVRWEGLCINSTNAANASATLSKDGTIRLCYGSDNGKGGMIGVSAGDGVRWLVSERGQMGGLGNAADVLFLPVGSLPEGLSFTADGRIVGTTERSGTYRVCAQVADALGATVSRVYELPVLATAEFDLGGHAVRTGAGELVQHLTDGSAAVAPALEPNSGWTFLFWDAPFEAVTGRQVIRAVWTDRDACAAEFEDFWTDHPELLAAAGGDRSAAARMRSPGRNGSGKFKSNGEPMLVWDEFVAGTDPTDETDVFSASISIVDGEVRVSFSPELEDERRVLRKYTTWGKKSLLDATWVEVPEGHAAEYNFYKVSVELRQ